MGLVLLWGVSSPCSGGGQGILAYHAWLDHLGDLDGGIDVWRREIGRGVGRWSFGFGLTAAGFDGGPCVVLAGGAFGGRRRE